MTSARYTAESYKVTVYKHSSFRRRSAECQHRCSRGRVFEKIKGLADQIEKGCVFQEFSQHQRLLMHVGPHGAGIRMPFFVAVIPIQRMFPVIKELVICASFLRDNSC